MYLIFLSNSHPRVLNQQTEIRTKLGDDETDAPIAGSAKEYLLSLEELPSEEEFVLGIYS